MTCHWTCSSVPHGEPHLPPTAVPLCHPSVSSPSLTHLPCLRLPCSHQRRANDWALLLFWPVTSALDVACRAAVLPRADKLAVMGALDGVETALGLIILLRLAANAVDVYTLGDVAAALDGATAAAQRAVASSLRRLRGGMVTHEPHAHSAFSVPHPLLSSRPSSGQRLP